MKASIKKITETIKRRRHPIITSAALVIVSVCFQNCQSDEFYEKADLVASRNARICQDGKSDNLICNPFGGPAPGDDEPADPARAGLIGHLFEGEDNWNEIDRYLASGYRHPEAIYFSNFNVPVRSFSEGFIMGSEPLKDRQGDRLIEWFGIQVKGYTVLPPAKTAGAYHIATLSDDGVRVLIDGRSIVNNPRTHAVTLDCANEVVEFQPGDEKTFELQYFQGPRHHIALMVFIKKVNNPGSFSTGNCASGNRPEDLIAAGYEVMSSAWFTLPQGY